MSDSRLVVLEAGMPPVRGEKIVYWREKAFMRRVMPAPAATAYPSVGGSNPLPGRRAWTCPDERRSASSRT